MEETDYAAQDGRFSGSARAEQDVHGPGLDRERDVIEGDAVAEPLGDVAKRDHRGAVRRGQRPMPRAISTAISGIRARSAASTWMSRRAVAISRVGGSSPDSPSRLLQR